MKTIEKSLETLLRKVTKDEAWQMLTYKMELLTDVPVKDLQIMVITLSEEITDLMHELGEIHSYSKVLLKYGSE